MAVTKAQFAKWFAQQKKINDIRYFDAHELVLLSTRAGVTNEMPPEELWGNCIPSLMVLDRLRWHIDYPLVITSGYRSPEYNKAIGGSDASQHMQFRAFDFTCNQVAPRLLADRLLSWRQSKEWVGGLGVYSTFVHLDTRGANATWKGKM